jgi:hypothetical protein
MDEDELSIGHWLDQVQGEIRALRVKITNRETLDSLSTVLKLVTKIIMKREFVAGSRSCRDRLVHARLKKLEKKIEQLNSKLIKQKKQQAK